MKFSLNFLLVIQKSKKKLIKDNQNNCFGDEINRVWLALDPQLKLHCHYAKFRGKDNFTIFFLSGNSFTDIDNSQDSKRREGSIFCSTLPLSPTHKHSDIYLQLCTWDDYHIFLITTLVFTRLLLDIYHLIELLFDLLMM